MQSQGNPQAMFRIHIACLFSLQELDLSGNNFGCLPKSIAQLSNLNDLKVNNCTSLQSFPKLPLNLGYIDGFGWSSLEMVPDLLRPNSLFEPKLFLSNCSKLMGNQGFIDLFIAVIKKSPQVSLSLSLSLSLTHNSKHHALYVSGTLS